MVMASFMLEKSKPEEAPSNQAIIGRVEGFVEVVNFCFPQC